MKTIIITLNFLLLSFFSCDKQPKHDDIEQNMDEIKNDAIINGNDFAYGSYLEYCNNNNLYLEKLSLSLLMNNKHNNLRSYFEVYVNIVEINNNNEYKAEYLNNLDSINRLYALHYLKEGARRNFITCQCTLEKVYRHKYGGAEISREKYDSLYSVLEKLPSLGRFYKVNKNNKSKIDSAID